MFDSAITPVIPSNRFGMFEKKAYIYRPAKNVNDRHFDDVLKNAMYSRNSFI